ncbi:MAG: HAD hydrolase family protein [Akkermansiaceae bacterium]|nr:HAD hydrolase family protein [Akkermansiaceae bacterium]
MRRKSIGFLKSSKKLLKKIRHDIEEQTGARWLEMAGEPAGIISQSEEEMEWIVGHIAPLVAVEPHFSWQRNSIYLRFGHRDFQKGSSLSEITKNYDLKTADCFAIGDSYNDTEMLDPAHAGMIACPANAVAAIQQKVTMYGGVVAKASHGYGSIEAINHFFC